MYDTCCLDNPSQSKLSSILHCILYTKLSGLRVSEAIQFVEGLIMDTVANYNSKQVSTKLSEI